MGVLGEIKWYSKLDLAEHQLNRAINLYLDEKDFISSITLAGAAEELLGKILNQVGVKNVLDEYIKSCTAFDENLKNHYKWFRNDRNINRNYLKHLEVTSVYADEPPPDEIPIFALAATDLIFRAINNHHKLNQESLYYTSKLSFNINRFYASEQ